MRGSIARGDARRKRQNRKEQAASDQTTKSRRYYLTKQTDEADVIKIEGQREYAQERRNGADNATSDSTSPRSPRRILGSVYDRLMDDDT